MVQEKDDALKTIKNELAYSNTVLKKFQGQNEKLDEILASRRLELDTEDLVTSIRVNLTPFTRFGRRTGATECYSHYQCKYEQLSFKLNINHTIILNSIYNHPIQPFLSLI